MTDQTDFTGLYRELGVEPDCSVDEFRLAYRRRVADLHPDRVGASGEDPLKTLNLRYAAALEFHRQYGRLPGALPPAAPRKEQPNPQQWQEEAIQAGDARTPGRSSGPSRLVVYGMLVLAGLLVWWLSRPDATPPGSYDSDVSDRERQTATGSATPLRLDMTPAAVIALLGEPIDWNHDNTQWLYGPSWVRFHCARLVDWYSSPLQPLKAASTRPNAVDITRLKAVEERHCPPMPPPRTRQWPTP